MCLVTLFSGMPHSRGVSSKLMIRICFAFPHRSTGIAMNPFTRRVSDLLPNQVHKKVSRCPSLWSLKPLTSFGQPCALQAIEVDAHLRVVGAPLGTVYAIGDAATVRIVIHNFGGKLMWLSAEPDRDFGCITYPRVGR
jgi:hypothetical protein